MKVVCIDNTIGNGRHLELNKVYDASETPEVKGLIVRNLTRDKYYIINTYPYTTLLHPSARRSTNHDIWIDKRSFISLEEFRQLKLDKILNNEI
jgi:hypothetical protein